MLEDVKKIIKKFNYKEMEYGERRIIDVLLKGAYKDYEFVILNLGTHPTAYVRIPKNNKYYEKGYDDIEVECHGGLTFARQDFHFNPIVVKDSWWIGWDYAHYDDYSDYTTYGKKWTTEEIFKEVVNVINELKNGK